MSTDAYELLAMLLRYVFVALGVVILFRAYRQVRKDARAHKKAMKQLPDAGLIGEVVDLDTGKSQPLPREGMMGSSPACDIRLKRRGVKRRHVLFDLVEGKGVRIKPHLGSRVSMEGVTLKNAAYALHGTHMMLGNAHIRIRLFAGLNVPNPAAFAPDMPGDVESMEGTEGTEDMVPQPFGWQGSAAPGPVPQMTWDFAYDPNELKNALEQQLEERSAPTMPMAPETMISPEMEQQEDYVSYTSPVERHRRSGRK